MVRTAEGSCLNERILCIQHSEHRVDLRNLDCLLPRHIRKNRRKPPCQHALAGTRRSHHQHVVSACRRNLKRPLDVLLPLDIAEIRQLRVVPLRSPRLLRRNGRRAGQVRRERRNAFHTVDREPFGKRRLRRVFLRDIERLDSELLCRQRHRKNARNRTQLSFQTQFTQKRAGLLRKLYKPRRLQNAEQDRKIVKRSGLFGARRGEIERNPADRKFVAAVLDGGAHTLSCLLDRSVRQPHHVKTGQSVCDIAFHGDFVSVQPAQPHRANMTHHKPQPSSCVFLYHIAFSCKNQPQKTPIRKMIYKMRKTQFACETSTEKSEFQFTLTAICAIVNLYPYVITFRR